MNTITIEIKNLSTSDIYADGSVKDDVIKRELKDNNINLLKESDVEGLTAWMREKGLYDLPEVEGYCLGIIERYDPSKMEENPDYCWDHIINVSLPLARKFLLAAQSWEKVYIMVPCYDENWDFLGMKPLFLGFKKVDAIINLTQHQATAEQLAAGVIDPAEKALVQKTLTFDSIPSKVKMANGALSLVIIAKESGAKRAMIGGAPFFMSTLERALIEHGITPMYAFSERVSIEESLPDGTVKKTNMFKHVGFVES